MTLLDAARELVKKRVPSYHANAIQCCWFCDNQVEDHKKNCPWLALRRAVEQEGQNAKQ